MNLSTSPIEQVLERLMSGEIGMEIAEQQLEGEEVQGQLSERYLISISESTVRLGYQGYWEKSILLHRLILIAAKEFTPRLSVWVHLVVGHLRIATNALWNRPDNQYLEFASVLGEQTYCDSATNSNQKATLAKELGCLYLDPYAAGREGFLHLEEWLRRAPPKVASAMPDVWTALERANYWLSLAIPGLTELKKLEALKARLQCIFAYEIYEREVDEVVAREVCVEAIELMHLATDREDLQSFVLRVARRLNVEIKEDPTLLLLSELDQPIPDHLSEVFGQRILSALHWSIETDCTAGLDLLNRITDDLTKRFSSGLRMQLNRTTISLLASCASEEFESKGFTERFIEIEAFPEHSIEAYALAGAVIRDVRDLAVESKEEEAIDILHELAISTPWLIDRHWAAITQLRVELLIGVGSDAHNEKRADCALLAYSQALYVVVNLKLPPFTLDILSRLNDVVSEASSANVRVFAEFMRQHFCEFQLGLVGEESEAIAECASEATVALQVSASAEDWFAVLRMAKGMAYSDAVLRQQSYAWRSDSRAQQLFAKYSELSRAPSCADFEQHSEAQEFALFAFKHRSLESKGSSIAEQRDGVAYELDRHIRLSATAVYKGASESLSLAECRQLLPADGVLVDSYSPRCRRDGERLRFNLIVTREEERLFVVTDQHEMRSMSVNINAAEYELTSDGVAAAYLRNLIQQNPTIGSTSAADEELLASDLLRYLGHGVEYLQSLYELGKRHLIIVPSGSLHFVPFHLLVGLDGALANNWTVSYLPSLDLIRRASDPYVESSNRASVFGLTYQSAWAEGRHTNLPGVAKEAIAVADALQTVPMLNDSVTRSAIMQALPLSSFTHIACHGGHDPVAPSLHTLHLTPEQDDDGQLFAADLLALDLRNVSLLTLSACETSLGRFDLNDNLSGLTASALAAGVSAVVGTLWPVSDDAAVEFFSMMYRQVIIGRTRLEAFRDAQLRTRELFPEDRDWGAFYYSGNW